jgi:enoyl-CoA hydratase/carnithine racemase
VDTTGRAAFSGGDFMQEILSRDVRGVTVVTLNRPERLNAFTPTGYRDLRIALARADNEPSVGAIVIKGGKRAFSTGADLSYLQDDANIDAMKLEFDRLLKVFIGLSKPLIAAAAGAVVGFGATLLLHCDVVLLASDARLRFPFVELGTVPEAGSSCLLPMAVGSQRAMDLILSARWFNATEAVDMGLAARALASDDVGPAALELAQRIADTPRDAVVMAKALLRESRRRPVERAVERELAAAASLAELHEAMQMPRGPAQD